MREGLKPSIAIIHTNLKVFSEKCKNLPPFLYKSPNSTDQPPHHLLYRQNRNWALGANFGKDCEYYCSNITWAGLSAMLVMVLPTAALMKVGSAMVYFSLPTRR